MSILKHQCPATIGRPLAPGECKHPTQHGQGEGGEGRWVGLGDAIHQVREWKNVHVHSQLMAVYETAAHNRQFTS